MNTSTEDVSSTAEISETDEASESSSDTEYSPRTRKNLNESKKSLQCDVMYPSPKEADPATEEIQRNAFGNSQIVETGNSFLEISSTEKSRIEHTKEDNSQYDKKFVGNTESSKIEGMDPSENKVSPSRGATLKTTDTGARGYVIVAMLEDSPEDAAAAEALMLAYMNKYANEYSKELLFAIDLTTLIRYLNKLDLRYIVYNTHGNVPTSPCDNTLDQALRILWKRITKIHGREFESKMREKRMNYRRFQILISKVAKILEDSKWSDVKSFLTNCLLLAQSTVYAEKSGLKDACEFIPLVICRIIQKRRDSGQFPVDFWAKLAEFALQFTKNFV